MPLVSAIVPTRDRPTFLAGAIETALAQTHDELEVVIVCDPPAEETRAVVERYAGDDRVRPVYNDEHLGLPASRNRAIEHADGEFVCILDDDDRWHPEKVERQLDVLDRRPDCGVVYTGGLLEQRGRIIGSYTPTLEGDIYPEILGSFDLKPYSGHMIRATCFETVGAYDTSFDRGEDWEHSIRIAREFQFAAIPEPLVVRGFHGDNVSNGLDVECSNRLPIDLEDATDIPGRIWRKYRDEIERYPAVERRLRHRRHLEYGWAEIDRNNRLHAIRHALEATKSSPSIRSLAVLSMAALGPIALETARRTRLTLETLRHAVSRTDTATDTPIEPPSGSLEAFER